MHHTLKVHTLTQTLLAPKTSMPTCLKRTHTTVCESMREQIPQEDEGGNLKHGASCYSDDVRWTSSQRYNCTARC